MYRLVTIVGRHGCSINLFKEAFVELQIDRFPAYSSEAADISCWDLDVVFQVHVGRDICNGHPWYMNWNPSV